MTAPLDPFAPDADAPPCAPLAEAGFFLLDDAGGRFVVDREFGVVSVRDQSLVARERGEVHTAKLRVVEASGESYELDLRLRITGRVPQLVGAEELADFLAAAEPALAPQPWTAFAAARSALGKAALELAPNGVFIEAPTPAASVAVASLVLHEAPPAPAAAGAAWSL